MVRYIPTVLLLLLGQPPSIHFLTQASSFHSCRFFKPIFPNDSPMSSIHLLSDRSLLFFVFLSHHYVVLTDHLSLSSFATQPTQRQFSSAIYFTVSVALVFSLIFSSVGGRWYSILCGSQPVPLVGKRTDKGVYRRKNDFHLFTLNIL